MANECTLQPLSMNAEGDGLHTLINLLWGSRNTRLNVGRKKCLCPVTGGQGELSLCLVVQKMLSGYICIGGLDVGQLLSPVRALPKPTRALDVSVLTDLGLAGILEKPLCDLGMCPGGTLGRNQGRECLKMVEKSV